MQPRGGLPVSQQAAASQQNAPNTNAVRAPCCAGAREVGALLSRTTRTLTLQWSPEKQPAPAPAVKKTARKRQRLSARDPARRLPPKLVPPVFACKPVGASCARLQTPSAPFPWALLASWSFSPAPAASRSRSPRCRRRSRRLFGATGTRCGHGTGSTGRPVHALTGPACSHVPGAAGARPATAAGPVSRLAAPVTPVLGASPLAVL